MKPFKAKHAAGIGAAVVTGAALWTGVYLLTGHRYRLYTNRLAARCWRGVSRLALPGSSLRPRRVSATHAGAQGMRSVTIRYRLDRAFGGTLMSLTCDYGPDSLAPRRVAMNGVPVDAATLQRIRADLAR